MRERVLWQMVLKEVRTTLRERHQWLGMGLALIALAGVVGATSAKLAPALGPVAHASFARPQIMALRWAAIVAGAGVGLFFALGYLLSATLASFAGEKEARTLEVVLASPLSDRRLFLYKCVSILVPMSVIGYAFTLVSSTVALVFAGRAVFSLPIALPLYVLVLSLPFMVLPAAMLISVGAIVSARSDTAKGAGQVLGAVTFGILFGGGYALPLVIRRTPLWPVIVEFGKAWVSMPFIAQYLLALLIVAVPTALALLIGVAVFRRDRLLA